MARQSNSNPAPLSADLLEILRDPQAIQEGGHGADPGRLELAHGYWLVSADTGYKYPIRDGIPVMLVEEGARWKDTPVDALPVPPPAAEPAPETRSSEVTHDSTAAGHNYALLFAIAVGAAVVLLLALIGLSRRRTTTVVELPAEPLVP